MRAPFSLIALVTIAAIVLLLARRQLDAGGRPAATPQAASAIGVGPAAPIKPAEVGRQVQDAIDDAARRTAEAASAAGN